MDNLGFLNVPGSNFNEKPQLIDDNSDMLLHLGCRIFATESLQWCIVIYSTPYLVFY